VLLLFYQPEKIENDHEKEKRNGKRGKRGTNFKHLIKLNQFLVTNQIHQGKWFHFLQSWDFFHQCCILSWCHCWSVVCTKVFKFLFKKFDGENEDENEMTNRILLLLSLFPLLPKDSKCNSNKNERNRTWDCNDNGNSWLILEWQINQAMKKK